MLFGFGHLVSVMSAIHGKVDSATVEARLKYLQRVPFPAPRADVGKGGRTYYSADDLMKIVVVFELIAASMLPAQAAAIVNDRWLDISPGLAMAWNGRSNPIASVLMVATPNTFNIDGQGSGRIDVTSADELSMWFKQRRRVDRRMDADDRQLPLGPRVTVVDLVSLAVALGEALEPARPVVEFIAMGRELETWVANRRQVRRTGT
jgi:hypothetical protein